MKIESQKRSNGLCGYFSYDENGRPPYGIYFLIVILSIIPLITLWFICHCVVKDIIISVTASVLASLIVAFVFDYSRYQSERRIKTKIKKSLLRRFKFSARLLVLYISNILTEEDKTKLTGYKVIEDFINEKFSDEDYKKNKDIKSIVFDFIDDTEMLVGIERDILDPQHLAQLYQIKLSFEEYLSGFKDLKNVESESAYNISRHKDFLYKFKSFLWANQEIFEKGGLLEDIGATTISQLKDYNQIDF